MKISAIISEYNPFHNGHKYLAEQLRINGSSHIISIMSGSFVQRGDCAAADKYSRAKMAVCSGIDLVLEFQERHIPLLLLLHRIFHPEHYIFHVMNHL